MFNSLYSMKICELLETYIIENECVKCRDIEVKKLSKENIENRVKNFNDIGIQKGKFIQIYCDKGIESMLLEDQYIKEAVYLELVNIYTK